MPNWPRSARLGFNDENLVAVDDDGQVLGCLRGNHVSQAWTNVDGFKGVEDWLCSYITWLLVDEAFRSNGIGGMLLERFARESAAARRDTKIASPQSGDNEVQLLEFHARHGYRRAVTGQVHRGPRGRQEDVA